MKYYLIDTSAFVYAIENLETIRLDFFAEKASGAAFLYMPQFCVTEVFNTYTRLFYRDRKIGGSRYTRWRGEFIKAIHDRQLVYCYDLHRYHNPNAHKICKIEHTTPYGEGEKFLSTFDILVIAMGMELQRIHLPNPVNVLTRDRRLATISAKDRSFAPPVWVE